MIRALYCIVVFYTLRIVARLFAVELVGMKIGQFLFGRKGRGQPWECTDLESQEKIWIKI